MIVLTTLLLLLFFVLQPTPQPTTKKAKKGDAREEWEMEGRGRELSPRGS